MYPLPELILSSLPLDTLIRISFSRLLPFRQIESAGEIPWGWASPATVSPEHHDSEPGPTPLHFVRHWPSVFPEPAPPGDQQHCYVAVRAVRLELILGPSTSTLLIHHPFISLRFLASSLSNLNLLCVHTTVVFLFPNKWCLHLPVMTLYGHMLSTPAPLDMNVGTGACSGQGGKVESITCEHQPWTPRRFSCTPVPLPFSHSGPRSCPTSWVLEWQRHGSWAAADPWWPQSPARHTGKNKATPKLTIHTAPAWKHKVLFVFSNVGDLGLIPALGRSPGEVKGYPLQYSDLENSMDCIVHGVTKSWTRLRDFHFTSASECLTGTRSHGWSGRVPSEARHTVSTPGHPLWSAASLILKKYLVSWFLIQTGKHKKLRPFWLLQVKAIGISIKNTCE